MKKRIIRLLIALIVLVILAVLAIGLFLNAAIKRGVETIGPKVTKVDIKLQSVSLSLLSGSGSIKGLVVGNPEGFQEPSAIRVGTASLALKPSSLLADKIIIRSIKVDGPEITYETTLRTSNLDKILANVEEATSRGKKESSRPQEPAQPKKAKPAKKLEVGEVIITGGRVRGSVTGLGGITTPLPDIRLTDLGKGPDGITASELAQKVLAAIKEEAAKVVSGATTDFGKGAAAAAMGAGSNTVRQITDGLLSPFKKKK